MTRRFFYVCAGLLFLAISYHLGVRNAGADGGDKTVVGFAVDAHKGDTDDEDLFVMMANGDVYYSTFKGLHTTLPSGKVGNFWSNAGTRQSR